MKGNGLGTKGMKDSPGKTAISFSNQQEWGSGVGWQAKECLRSNRKTKTGEKWKERRSRGLGGSKGMVEVKEALRKKQSHDSSSWIQRSTLSLQNDSFPESFG